VKIGVTDGETTITNIRVFDFADKRAMMQELNNFASKYAYSDSENARIMSPNGYVYDLVGTEYNVNTELIGKEALKGSIGIHNHPVEPGEDRGDSFSFDDIHTSNKNLEGKQYLVSGMRFDAYEFNEYYLVDGLETIWDNTRYKMLEAHLENKTTVIFEQQDILRELGDYLKGFKYYENIRK
jgi:hypothetical protein